MRKLVRNARIYTAQQNAGDQAAGEPFSALRGSRMGQLAVYDPGAMLIRDGLIERVGPQKDVLAALHQASAAAVSGRHHPDLVIDADGRCVIPGFVDPHTHICFAATREDEFRMRLAGADYMEIHKRGGGIMSSVRTLRAASTEQLMERTLAGLRRSLSFGVTTVEVKSGYGLSTEAELRQLEVIDRAAQMVPQDVVATFLGAHSIPAEYKQKRKEFVRLVIDEMLPAAAQSGIPRYCDIFTEDGVFSVEESERILREAARYGMGLKAHVDEIVNLHGAAMAARLGCVSAEHLIAADDDGLCAMAEAGTIAVVLPGTSFSIRKPFARAREMVDLGVPLALATDCNPGSCYTESMPFIYTLAVMQLGLSMEEALTAVTLNAAHAIGMADRVGSLETGKQADFVVLDGASPAVIAYHLAVNPVVDVYKRGERVAGV